jgi:protein-S-isoprenylcysteine O-methyltransferase
MFCGSTLADVSRTEEVLLIKFFGDEYVDYRKKVGVWIPFIS